MSEEKEALLELHKAMSRCGDVLDIRFVIICDKLEYEAKDHFHIDSVIPIGVDANSKSALAEFKDFVERY